MTPNDLDALRRAVAWGERYQKSEPQIVVLPAPMPPEGSPAWIEAATRCAAMAQAIALRLKPWDAEPCETSDDGRTDPACFGRKPHEVALLRRMTSNGVSRFEIDPIKAIAAAERQQAEDPSRNKEPRRRSGAKGR